MGLPVTTVAAGGLPVVEVTARGLSVTETARGLAVTKVLARGLPVQYGSAEAISAAPPLDGLAGLTGAYSASRKLLTAYGGPFYDPVASDANVWRDQTAAVRNLTALSATQRPAVVTGPTGRAMLTFMDGGAGVGDAMVGAAASNFISAAGAYIIASVIIDAASPGTICADQQGFFALKYNTPGAFSENWGNGELTTVEPFVVGQPYVFEFIHSGGVLGFRMNGGLTRSIASGATTDLTNVFVLSDTVSKFRIGELATVSTVPTAAQRDTLAANFKAYMGA